MAVPFTTASPGKTAANAIAAAAPQDSAVSFGGSSSAARAEPVILVAEDHPDSRDALQTLLEVHGYRVHTAANGLEAVNRAMTTVPDLILMDIMMPVMDGFEATRELRTRKEFHEVPIIALTALDGARELVFAAGCDDYLPKPIDIRTFLDRIRAWLKSGRTPA